MTHPNSIPLAAAIAHRDAWLEATLALATAQQYSITTGGSTRQLTRANLPEARRMLEFWERRVLSLTPGAGRRVRFGVPGS
jgi:hypothetical protein